MLENKAYRMTEKRKEYIDRLLVNLKSLEESVLNIKSSDSLPFSFFNDSFHKTQEVSQLLHELERLQIEEMKQQMERLVLFLSEKERRNSAAQEGATSGEQTASEGKQTVSEGKNASAAPSADNSELSESVRTPSPTTSFPTSGNRYAKGIVLPEYKNPRSSETGAAAEKPQHASPQTEPESKPVAPSLNDRMQAPPTVPESKPVAPSLNDRMQAPSTVPESKPVVPTLNDRVQAPPTVLDLKRNISLNDRFLFQRELFHNDREEMNSMLARLNAFNNYEDAESYLREQSGWNFDNPTVKDFLRVIKKGFE
jgi:hypothetical protein